MKSVVCKGFCFFVFVFGMLFGRNMFTGRVLLVCLLVWERTSVSVRRLAIPWIFGERHNKKKGNLSYAYCIAYSFRQTCCTQPIKGVCLALLVHAENSSMLSSLTIQ